ncbi:hypothetical protein N9H20_06040 [Planktomarina temperata]|nr:hypothetical protein [Planktomarina temperata]
MTRRAMGPVTAAGKAISAQNARRHGLSAEPAADLVSAWFNVILDNSVDTCEEPNADTPRREVALRLAIAEARYHRALDKLQTHAQEPNSTQVRADEFRGIMRQEIASLVDEGRDGRHNLAALEHASSALRRLGRLSRDVERERRLYRRYLGEARAQRSKALRAWCAFNSGGNKNSRNELKSHEWVGT